MTTNIKTPGLGLGLAALAAMGMVDAAPRPCFEDYMPKKRKARSNLSRKSVAVQKRRKANKLARKQRKLP